jgi:hypothetical protein
MMPDAVGRGRYGQPGPLKKASAQAKHWQFLSRPAKNIGSGQMPPL